SASAVCRVPAPSLATDRPQARLKDRVCVGRGRKRKTAQADTELGRVFSQCTSMEHHLAKYLLTVGLKLLQNCLHRNLIVEGQCMPKIIEPSLGLAQRNLRLL